MAMILKFFTIIQNVSSNILLMISSRADANNTPTSNVHFKELKLENLAQMVAGVMGNNPLECLTQFRELLNVEINPPIQEVIDAHVVPCFVEFLFREDDPWLQYEATWIIGNIALGTSDNIRVVINQGALPHLVELVKDNPNRVVRDLAIWALGNIAADSPPYRDLVLEAGAMEPLLWELETKGMLDIKKSATWTLSKFCSGKPQLSFERVKIALPMLAELICKHKDEEVLTNSCWALSYLSDGPNDKIQAVIEAGVCKRLVELLMNPSPAVQTPVLQTIGNILTGNNQQKQLLINHNVLPCLLSLLVSPVKGIRKDACQVISNITSSSSELLSVQESSMVFICQV